MFHSPGKTHINRELISKNTIITIYPVRLLKKPDISFVRMASIKMYYSWQKYLNEARKIFPLKIVFNNFCISDICNYYTGIIKSYYLPEFKSP